MSEEIYFYMIAHSFKLVSQCPVKTFNNDFSVIIIFESCLMLFICTGLKTCFHIVFYGFEAST